MFVNVPVMKYSNFFIHYMNRGEDHMIEHYENHSTEPFDNLTGCYAYANPQFGFLHPLHAKLTCDSYDDIVVQNVKSHLKRNRFMKNAFHIGFVWKYDFDDPAKYIKDQIEARKKLKVISYGSADTVDQILSRFAFLDRIKDRRFFISLGIVVKSEESSPGGWRQHKQGPYIGTKKMRYEYFADEGPEFDHIFTYTIHEVDLTPDGEVLETENFKLMISENTEKRFHAHVFNKQEELVCYAFNEDDKIHFGHGGPNGFLFEVDRVNYLADFDKLLNTIVLENS